MDQETNVRVKFGYLPIGGVNIDALLIPIVEGRRRSWWSNNGHF